MLKQLWRDYLIRQNSRKIGVPKGGIKPDLHAIKSVLLLIDSNRVSHAEIVKSRKVFEDQGMRTACITYSKEPQDTAQKILQLHDKCFSFGVPLKKEWLSAQEWSPTYDLILCYNPKNVPNVHLLMSHLKGKLRVGSERQRKELYDIIVAIDQDKNMHRFAQQTLLLLQNLNKYELV